LRELIHLLKYEQVRPAASILGRMLGEIILELAAEFSSSADSGGAGLPLVVPVPLHESKQRQRGFNQSELIARAMVKSFTESPLSLDASVLRRHRVTESQTGLSRVQRRANMRGAFVVARPREIAGRDILLVDDVFTTGTTVSECARVLRRAGANRVWVVTVARVLKTENAHAIRGEREDEPDGQSIAAGAPLVRAAQV
jgi:ComF family protein